jgi:hypothetical protein
MQMLLKKSIIKLGTCILLITLGFTGLAQSDQEKGFVSLFNGKNLDGWTGNKQSYGVENGMIVIKPDGGGSGGNLFSEKEYSDFILRFEFQLTPGANNGLGIRTPISDNVAYEGIELQIIDNKGTKYGKLKPWQHHGSVYGVVAAKQGFQKPAGEWNQQEVVVRGSHIQVILNRHIIVDADVLKVSENGTIDGKDHPGLKRTSGHIGFLGHGDVVRFRNIRIKKL